MGEVIDRNGEESVQVVFFCMGGENGRFGLVYIFFIFVMQDLHSDLKFSTRILTKQG